VLQPINSLHFLPVGSKVNSIRFDKMKKGKLFSLVVEKEERKNSGVITYSRRVSVKRL
jgi:hypothetical protein